MLHEQLSNTIIGCAYKVHNTLGYGFLESVYEKALLIELEKNNLKAEPQKRIHVHYGNQIVGEFIADILIENKIIIELKSVAQLNKKHEVQLVNYLTATNTEIGLLINFGESKVEVKRKIRELTAT